MTQHENLIKETIEFYEKRMDIFFEKYPMPLECDRLDTQISELIDFCLCIIDISMDGKTSDLAAKASNDFSFSIRAYNNELYRCNKIKINDHYKNELNKQWDNLIAPIYTFDCHQHIEEEFTNQFDQFKKNFLSKAPLFNGKFERSEAFEAWSKEKDVDSIKKMLHSRSEICQATEILQTDIEEQTNDVLNSSKNAFFNDCSFKNFQDLGKPSIDIKHQSNNHFGPKRFFD